MKAFFSMSFRGDIKTGYLIARSLNEFGYKLTTDSYNEGNDLPKKFYNWTSEERQTHYRGVFNSLRSSDIVILESSIHSVTVGLMIQEAIELRKPLLILIREGVKLTFLDGLSEVDGRLLKIEYTSESLSTKIKEGIAYLTEKLGTRFTMILPPDIIQHLDGVSKRGLSRSEYIRNLIYSDIKES